MNGRTTRFVCTLALAAALAMSGCKQQDETTAPAPAAAAKSAEKAPAAKAPAAKAPAAKPVAEKPAVKAPAAAPAAKPAAAPAAKPAPAQAAKPAATPAAAQAAKPVATPAAAPAAKPAATPAAAQAAKPAAATPAAKPAAPIVWVKHPAQPVSITATEVTVAQFRSCVDAGACKADTFKSCNYGMAGREDHPMNCVNFFGAEQFCAHAGGRVCSEREWLDSCSGTDGRPFPYGDIFDLPVCNSQSGDEKVEGRPLQTWPAGSQKACAGGLDGLYDMAGNVAEWVDGCKGTYCKFRGAGFRSNAPVERFAACKGVCAGNQKSFSSPTIGIRCCK